MAVEELKVMTKQEAIQEVHRRFRGSKMFIYYFIGMIASTPNFKGIESYENWTEGNRWERYLRVTITFGENGYKQLHYRKGKQGCEITSHIQDYVVITINGAESEEYRWDV